MKKAVIVFALAAMISCNNAPTNDTVNAAKDTTATATKPAENPSPPMSPDEQAKRYVESMTPGAMHKMLTSYAGKWRADYTFWMHENAAAENDTLIYENKMILGGRYLQTVETGSFDGKPYNCIDMLGYDNLKKMFVFTQQDNMGTGIIYMEGTYDSTTNLITVKGHYDDPGGMTELRQTYKIIDDKHAEIEWYGTRPGGKEIKISVSKLTKI